MTMSTKLVIVEQNGDSKVVQTTLEDRLAFETALRKNRSWGKLEDSALKLQPFLAFNAAKRDGEKRTWEEFTTGKTAAANVEAYVEEETDDEDLEVEGVGKDTQPDPSTTSASPSAESTAARRGSGAAKKARS